MQLQLLLQLGQRAQQPMRSRGMSRRAPLWWLSRLSFGAEDEVEVGQGNSKIVIAVFAVCSNCVNVPYDPSTALRYDAIETDGVRHPMPVPQDTAIVCMTCFNMLPSSAAVKEVDNVLFVCPRCTNLASTALDVTKRYVCVAYLTPSFDLLQ
jgi:hypothetical protein